MITDLYLIHSLKFSENNITLKFKILFKIHEI